MSDRKRCLTPLAVHGLDRARHVARGLFVAVAVAVAVSVPVMFGGAGAFAQDGAPADVQGDRQFHIGTFQTGTPSPTVTPGAPGTRSGTTLKPTGGSSQSNGLPVERTPSALLERALNRLEAKRTKLARRLLEILVARYPTSNEADAARSQLATLYSRNAVGKPDSSSQILPRVGQSASIRPGPQQLTSLSDTDGHIEPVGPVDEALSQQLGLEVGDRVFFPADSDRLGAKARAVLQRQALWLKRRGIVTILVSGHADEGGGDDKNLSLSKRRANAVGNRLIEEGVARHRIKIIARGHSQPIAKCRTQLCAAQNRRVVTSVLQRSALRVHAKPQR